MKCLHEENPSLGISELCGLFGVSRQAYYKGNESDFSDVVSDGVVLELVGEIRARCPGTGTRKLQKTLESFYGIRYGRDRLFSLLERENMLLRTRHRKPRTTYSGHLFPVYPNLVRGLVPTRPNEVWVSDITYIKVEGRVMYLFLITDMYSRKIVGWALSDNMLAENAIAALHMAHHSEAHLERKWKHYPWYHKRHPEENANFAGIPLKGDTSVTRCKPETVGASSPDGFNPPERFHEPTPL